MAHPIMPMRPMENILMSKLPMRGFNSTPIQKS
jgi:hypothetical protein